MDIDRQENESHVAIPHEEAIERAKEWVDEHEC